MGMAHSGRGSGHLASFERLDDSLSCWVNGAHMRRERAAHHDVHGVELGGPWDHDLVEMIALAVTRAGYRLLNLTWLGAQFRDRLEHQLLQIRDVGKRWRQRRLYLLRIEEFEGSHPCEHDDDAKDALQLLPRYHARLTLVLLLDILPVQRRSAHTALAIKAALAVNRRLEGARHSGAARFSHAALSRVLRPTRLSCA